MNLSSAIAQVAHNTMRVSGRDFLERSIAAIGTARYTLPSDKPLRGRLALVLGAGPSLDLVAPHLFALQAAGACIVATNTAVPVCAHYAVQPDVVCIAEKDPKVVAHCESVGGGTLVALDSVVSAAAWERFPKAALVWKAEPAFYEWALRLGCEPLLFSESVGVMAVAVARYLGASTIVLAGHDCAYASDGRMYATHSPFADLRWEVREGLVRTLSVLEQPSKIRAPAPAWTGINNAGEASVTEPSMAPLPEAIARAGRGCEMHAIGPEALVVPGVGMCTLDELLDPDQEWRMDRRWYGQRLCVRSIRDPRLLLCDIRDRATAIDPERDIYPPPNLPALQLVMDWQHAGGAAACRDRLVRSLAEGKRVTLQACERALEAMR